MKCLTYIVQSMQRPQHIDENIARLGALDGFYSQACIAATENSQHSY